MLNKSLFNDTFNIFNLDEKVVNFFVYFKENTDEENSLI